jgi:hypothetical protein
MLRYVYHQSLIATENSMGAGYASSWTQMQGYLATPLVKFYHTIKPEDSALRDSLAGLLKRMWENSETQKTAAGGLSGNTFVKPEYNNITLDRIGQVDYLALVWKHFGTGAARDQAINNALAVIGYHQRSSPVDLDNYSPAIFKSNQYAYSETKLHGKIGIHGRKLLEYEYDSLVPIQTGDGALGVEDGLQGKGLSLKIGRAMPNPFNPSCAITITVPAKLKGTEMAVGIYNVSGKLIRSMEYNFDRPGRYRIIWDGKDRALKSTGSGIYLFKFRTPSGLEKVRTAVKIK